LTPSRSVICSASAFKIWPSRFGPHAETFIAKPLSFRVFAPIA
jgi:hypothetical protein